MNAFPNNTKSQALGKPLSQLKTAEDLIEKLDAIRNYRMPLEKQWKLNLAFYKGKQYSFYPPRSNRLESLLTDEGSKPRHRVRLISNQIMPGVHTLLAQLTKTKPRIYATPGSGADAEIRAAQMAESLFEHWWGDLGLDEHLDEALRWSIIGGSGYWKISWDPYAAKQMRFVLDPQGQPIVDEALKTEFIAQLQQHGVEPQEKVVYMGDIKVEALSPFDVYIDPAAKVFEDAKFIICAHNLDPDEIKVRWGKDLQADAVPVSPDQNLPFQNAPDSRAMTVRRIYVGYFKPTAAMPNGRYVVFTEGADKQILADEKWPYPTHDLPIVRFHGVRVPGSIYDDAVVTHAVPLQKELNRTISQIVEYKNYTINPVMTAPVGSLQTRRTTEPGQVLEYAPIGNGLKPEFEQLPSLPPYVFNHLENISARLQDAFLSASVLEGKVPPNVEAGIAIDLLQEMATDKLAPLVKLIESSLARSGQLMLSLAQKYYIEPRLLKIRGSGGSTQVRQFAKADIDGNISIKAEVGSGLPRTRAGRQARIERMVELGILDPKRAIRHIEVADLEGVQKNIQANEDFAYRNIEKIIAGRPINPEAIQEATQALQQGINPETGESLQSPEEAQTILFRASLTPPLGIDFDTHIDVTSNFMVGVEFEQLNPQSRLAVTTYFNKLLQEASKRSPKPQPEAVKVNYQLRGTTGPSTSSKILQAAGLSITPEDTLEPPLETWVTDSIDKPDTDASGPGQEGNDPSMMAKALVEMKMADAKLKAEALNRKKQTVDITKSASDEDRQQQLHQMELRKKAAEIQAIKQKAKNASKEKNASSSNRSR